MTEETKAAPDPSPLTDEEQKISAQVTKLRASLDEARRPWMNKRWNKTLERMARCEGQLTVVLLHLRLDPSEPLRRKAQVASLVYHRDPFSFVKLKGESLWVRLRKSLGKEHQAQIDELYRALKAYVESVSLQFISAK